MIKATIVGSERINVKLNEMPGNVTQSVAKRVQIVLFTLEGNVKSKKLTRDPLHVRSNRLRSSVHSSPVNITDEKISGTVGTNVIYAAIHEYGYTGPANIKEHLRMMKKAFGREFKNPRQIAIKAFTRNVNMPERSFLRSQMREDENFIKEQIDLGAMEGARL